MTTLQMVEITAFSIIADITISGFQSSGYQNEFSLVLTSILESYNIEVFEMGSEATMDHVTETFRLSEGTLARIMW